MQRVVRERQRKRFDERCCVEAKRRPEIVDRTNHGRPIGTRVAVLAVHVEIHAAACLVELPDARVGLAALAQVDTHGAVVGTHEIAEVQRRNAVSLSDHEAVEAL